MNQAVRVLDSESFKDLLNLRTHVLPKSMTHIDPGAFPPLKKLTTIKLASGAFFYESSETISVLKRELESLGFIVYQMTINSIPIRRLNKCMFKRYYWMYLHFRRPPYASKIIYFWRILGGIRPDFFNLRNHFRPRPPAAFDAEVPDASSLPGSRATLLANRLFKAPSSSMGRLGFPTRVRKVRCTKPSSAPNTVASRLSLR